MRSRSCNITVLGILTFFVFASGCSQPADDDISFGGTGDSTPILSGIDIASQNSSNQFSPGGEVILTATLRDQDGKAFNDGTERTVNFVAVSTIGDIVFSENPVVTSTDTAETTFTAPLTVGALTITASVGAITSAALSVEVTETPGGCTDKDGDGYGVGTDCQGTDCDDTDDTLYSDCTSDVTPIEEGEAASIQVTINGQAPDDPYLTAAGSSFDINFKVLDSSGDSVPNATVAFALTGTTIGALSSTTAKTNSAGVGTVTFDAVNDATFNGKSATISLTSGKAVNDLLVQLEDDTKPARIVLSAEYSAPVQIQEEESVAITATVYGDRNGLMDGESVRFSFTPVERGGFLNNQGTQQNTITKTTNNQGESLVSWKSFKDQVGQVFITAEIPNNNEVSTAFLSMTVLPIPEVVGYADLAIGKGTILRGETTKITVTVYNSEGELIEDGTEVSFNTSYAGVTLTSESYTSEGVATGTFTAALSDTEPARAGTARVEINIADSLQLFDFIKIEEVDLASLEYYSADPIQIGVSGSGLDTTSIIKFNLTNELGLPGPDGVDVSFTLFGPNGGEAIQPAVASTVNGIATTVLKAGIVAGSVRIDAQATFTARDGTVKTLKTSTTKVSILAAQTSAKGFSVVRDVINQAGFLYSGLEWNITAFLSDRFSNFVPPGTMVSFYSEAGAIGPNGSSLGFTDNQGAVVVPAISQAPHPRDVGRNAMDEGVSTMFTSDMWPYWGVGHWAYNNPRDGRNRILATTVGEEAFDDENANGKYDQGENFTDLSEPFIDSNDNGIWDGPEKYTDANSNGKWDPAEPFDDFNEDGVWNAGGAAGDCSHEPYLDLNNSGSYDAGEPYYDANNSNSYSACIKEPYEDVNNDGQYNAAEVFVDKDLNNKYDEAEFFVDYNNDENFNYGNGEWDSDTMIWTSTNTLWTGNAIFDIVGPSIGDPAANGYTQLLTLDQEAGNTSYSLTFRVSDENGNPLPPESSVAITITTIGAVCQFRVAWADIDLPDALEGHTDYGIGVYLNKYLDSACYVDEDFYLNFEITQKLPETEIVYVQSVPGHARCMVTCPQ